MQFLFLSSLFTNEGRSAVFAELTYTQTFHAVNMAYITGRKKGFQKEHGYEDMRDYIRREMAVEFDTTKARDRWLELLPKGQVERMRAGLEHGGKAEEATAKEALHANQETKTAGLKKGGKYGRGMGQQAIKEIPVILL